MEAFFQTMKENVTDRRKKQDLKGSVFETGLGKF